MTDPFRPFGAPVAAQFDRTRLERAGIDPAVVDELEAAFPNLSADERRDFAQFVTSNSDAAIAGRFGSGPPPAPVTRETLEAETVDDLERRIREWNEAHPDEHLATSGRKAELVGRLLDAYEGEQEQTGDDTAGGNLPPAPDGTNGAATAAATGTVAAQTVPTAPTATNTDGTATDTQTPDATGAGTTTTAGGTP